MCTTKFELIFFLIQSMKFTDESFYQNWRRRWRISMLSKMMKHVRKGIFLRPRNAWNVFAFFIILYYCPTIDRHKSCDWRREKICTGFKEEALYQLISNVMSCMFINILTKNTFWGRQAAHVTLYVKVWSIFKEVSIISIAIIVLCVIIGAMMYFIA